MMENGQRYYLTLINVALVVISMAIVVYLIVSLDPSREAMVVVSILSLLVGSIITQNSNSQQWWFGTNKGTSDTTAVIRDIALQPPNTSTEGKPE